MNKKHPCPKCEYLLMPTPEGYYICENPDCMHTAKQSEITILNTGIDIARDGKDDGIWYQPKPEEIKGILKQAIEESMEGLSFKNAYKDVPEICLVVDESYADFIELQQDKENK